VLQDLIGTYRRLDPALQEDVALLSLPMGSRKQNALIVNALQRCSSVVVQNSLREGFGLTVTEAMWKQRAVIGSQACGIRQQIRDGIDGRLIADCQDAEKIAGLLDEVLDDVPGRSRYGRSAQLRVHDEFLVFTQARRWLEVLAEHAGD
jgi:trehalose synthase